MSSSVIASPAPENDHNGAQGFCVKCHKIWLLDTEQGVCRWCGQPSSCQTTRTITLRSFKSNGSRSRKQVPVKSNGYDHLEGEWLVYYRVASQFAHKALSEDREDLLHDIIITLADVERNNGHKPFTEAIMYRIASRAVADYWRSHYEITNGLDCGHCGKAQRHTCRKNDLYTVCPKAIKLERLNKPVLDAEGNVTELGELIADDKTLDLPDWTNPSFFLLGYPQRLVAIAEKIQNGENLTPTDSQYLWRFRKREQKELLAV